MIYKTIFKLFGGSKKKIAEREAESTAFESLLAKDSAGKQLDSFAKLQLTTEEFSKNLVILTDETTQIATSVEELAANSQSVASSAEATAQEAKTSDEQAAKGNEAISSLVGDMDSLESAVKTMADGINRFIEFSQQINSLTAKVRDIAQQTNLLALNASIEAARAGESGKGFSVVANEVKQLAINSEATTSQIEKVLHTMNKLSSEVGKALDNSLSRLSKSTEALEDVAMTLADGQHVVKEVNSQVLLISTSIKEQSHVTNQIASSINAIQQTLEKQLKQSEELQQIAKDVLTDEKELSEKLRDQSAD
ncbi:MAG: methyl-accepting chemotaxis protein [Gammaproteobacteria bacterium]|nr:methyl-accepting chemotaxis protein [Gammaproteobacteria bacterium]MDH5693170.1 methyl-accepting chemotaxis protein [Gammaproteobacteria bacterium]